MEVCALTIYYILGGFVLLCLLYLLACYVCFRLTFYVPRRRKRPDYHLPPGKVYEPYYDKLRAWIDASRALPHEDVSITSHDGLRLHGAYYECDPDAPCEILIHGYRGSAERDMAAGIERCFEAGHNVLFIDQRAAGKSEGHVISFGANEQYDCLAWINFLNEKRGRDKGVILAGLSMGAATVMLAAGHKLPDNVLYVLADCGYSSSSEIIKKVLRENLHLPLFPFYPMIRLGGMLFGGFDVNAVSPVEAVKKATVPMLFIHGTADGFVPFYMSCDCHDACASPHKRLLLIDGANHALCLIADADAYHAAIVALAKESGLV